MNGLKTLMLGIILTNILIAYNSCQNNFNSYAVTFSNNYFEELYNFKFGKITCDTIHVNQSTNTFMFLTGYYDLTFNTKSGLIISSGVYVKGSCDRINLIFTEHGKIKAE